MIKAFRFKQFELRDDACGMKIGADAVLLGAWSPFDSPEQTLDVGAGSGILSLILAQRFPKTTITAIELDKAAALQCAENFTNSPFNNQFRIINQDFTAYSSPTKFDAIVCNPPFFKEEHQNENLQRNMARQSKFLPLDSFFKTCNLLSHQNTKISLLFPTNEEEDLLKTALQFNWHPTEIYSLKGNSTKDSKRTLYLFEKQNFKTIKKELIIEVNRGEYTPEYKALTKEYYLKF